jgi:serine/threonine-protein kinase SRPK3
MLTADDASMLTDLEKAELEDPSPMKVIDDRTIYTSRMPSEPKNGLRGHLVLCDFGEARIGNLTVALFSPGYVLL